MPFVWVDGGSAASSFKTSACSDLGGLMTDERKVPCCSPELNVTAIAMSKPHH